MDNVEVMEVMKVTEEVESCQTQMDTSPPKKRKTKCHKTYTEKTKKPRSAYLLYYFDVHQIMQQEIPNLPQSEINKRISESWRRLSVAEKSYYLEKAKLELEGTYSPTPSPSKELPGFRKILPRANYFVLAKGCTSNAQPGDSVPDVSSESLDCVTGGGLSSITVKVECPASGPTGEVEQYPQALTIEDMPDETTAASNSKTQGILPYTSFSVLSNTETSTSGSEMPQVVALIPTQNLLAQSSLGSVTAVGPVMMVSNVEQYTKPSYNMPMKTYTRRGRGKCVNPSCSFVYVTRHKPPKCPECGQYLGGKWIPAAKNVKSINYQSKKTKVKQLVLKQSNENSKAASPTAEGDSAAGKTKVAESNKEQTCSSEKPATPGGSTAETKDKTKSVDDDDKGGTSQDNAVTQKKPVRPILPAYYNKNNAVFITVPSNKGKLTNANATTSSAPRQSLSGLKPSTLKQLGQTLQTNSTKQDASVLVEGPPTVASLDRRMNIVSVVPFKQRTITNFNLGLPTARGRGWCKNPACLFMYKNRHKPAVCPKCGYALSQKDTKGIRSDALLDPYKTLTNAQKDLQHQTTIQLIRRNLQFAESESELQETLNLIQELNSLQIILIHQSNAEREDNIETETLFETGWPHFFESAATHCGLCNYPLFKGGEITVAGQVDCWLLTETLMHTVSLQLKVCLNIHCLALHSFTDIHSGLFNIGNRLLVSIDLFLKIRASIKFGQTPSHAVETLLNHVPNHPFHTLDPQEVSLIQELLQSGYWAFECLTVRDYNDMICGICGVAPKLEIAQRQNNLLALKNVEFIWPESSGSDEVHVDDFWLTMESEAIEQAAFPSEIPIIRVDASIIAPFIPPLMRSQTVINTEKDKILSPTQKLSGDPSVLVRLIHDGHLRLDKLDEHSEEEVKTIMQRCGANITQEMTKDELMASLLSLYSQVHNGMSTTPEPQPFFTAGKLSKVCPHKLVCGSKCLVRQETARDHVDLLLSSRYWPPVYVSDCAQQVALCTDMHYPELATQMWGRNQGCFCDPFENPEIVSCTELQEQPHSTDLPSVDENQPVHPVTNSLSRWLVHPPLTTQTEEPLKHHSMLLCRDLQPYVNLLTENKKENAEQAEQADKSDGTDTVEAVQVSQAQQKPVVFNNTAFYYLYNRLVDFLSSRDIVNQQISQVLQSCQPGEVVIRDTLYRLGVAKIDTQKDEEVSEMESQSQAETVVPSE